MLAVLGTGRLQGEARIVIILLHGPCLWIPLLRVEERIRWEESCLGVGNDACITTQSSEIMGSQHEAVFCERSMCVDIMGPHMCTPSGLNLLTYQLNPRLRCWEGYVIWLIVVQGCLQRVKQLLNRVTADRVASPVLFLF